MFNLLEVKSTVNKDDLENIGFYEETSASGLIYYLSMKKDKDIVFRIQKASEGLLDSSYKSKNRLDSWIDESSYQPEPHLKFSEICSILQESGPLDTRLSPNLIKLLDEKIRPSTSKLVPYIMTQYNRIHLVHKDRILSDLIRVTIDPGVEYFRIILDDEENYETNPSSTAEFLRKERFYRLEFKMNISNLQEQDTSIINKISEIVSDFKAVAYLSKKWTGATLVSERHIEDQALWNELVDRGKEISGFFKVHPSWFNYRKILDKKGFFELIQNSKTFKVHEKNPKVLVKSENTVTGYLGIPIPSLIVNIEGPYIKYSLPIKSNPVKLPKNKPAFFINEENKHFIRTNEITSKDGLEKALPQAIEISGVSEFRSYGFLVVARSSKRVYKLTVERKTDLSNDNRRKVNTYCKMRYIGRIDALHQNLAIQEIYSELEQFYNEFSSVMNKNIDNYNEGKT
jgi:hypothetical protein